MITTSANFRQSYTIKRAESVLTIDEVDRDDVPSKDFLDQNSDGLIEHYTAYAEQGGDFQGARIRQEVEKFREFGITDGAISGLRDKAKKEQTQVVEVENANQIFLRAETLNGRDWSGTNRASLREYFRIGERYETKDSLAFDTKTNEFIVFESPSAPF